jgi:hypothetical protein
MSMTGSSNHLKSQYGNGPPTQFVFIKICGVNDFLAVVEAFHVFTVGSCISFTTLRYGAPYCLL